MGTRVVLLRSRGCSEIQLERTMRVSKFLWNDRQEPRRKSVWNSYEELAVDFNKSLVLWNWDNAANPTSLEEVTH